MDLFKNIFKIVGGAEGAYGRRVRVPGFDKLDSAMLQQKQAQANLDVAPQAMELASKVNAFSHKQIMEMLNESIPGYQQMLNRTTANTNALLKGELPSDVVNSILNTANAKAVSGGVRGSAFGTNFSLESLGINSLQAQQMGASNLSNLQGMMMNTMPLFDFTTAFLSASQRIGFEQQQQQMKYNQELMSAQAAAAPDPSKIAMYEGIGGTVDDIVTIAAGGMGGMAGMAAGGMMGGEGKGGKSFGGGTGYGGQNFNWMSLGSPQGSFMGTGE